MNDNLLRGNAFILRCSAECSTSVLRPKRLLLILAEIAKCQCVSTATCERAFSVQNTIKQKLRNRMSTSNLESMMRVAIEGPNNDFDDILTSALDLWKDVAKFRYLYSNPERCTFGAFDDALEEAP